MGVVSTRRERRDADADDDDDVGSISPRVSKMRLKNVKKNLHPFFGRAAAQAAKSARQTRAAETAKAARNEVELQRGSNLVGLGLESRGPG